MVQKPIPAMRAYLDGIAKGEAGSEEWPVAVAALGPKMLALSAERSRGALPYNVTPEHTKQAKAILGPSKWLAVEQKVCLETDPAKARALGRKELARYMGLPNYRNNWLRIGFTEAELADGGNDRFIDGDGRLGRRGDDQGQAAGASRRGRHPVCPPAGPRRRRASRARRDAEGAGGYLSRRVQPAGREATIPGGSSRTGPSRMIVVAMAPEGSRRWWMMVRFSVLTIR